MALAAAGAWARVPSEDSACQDKSTPQERGAVVVSISANNPFPGLHTDLELVRVDGAAAGKTCRLVADDSAAAFATTYIAAEVPAGDYRVLGVSGFNASLRHVLAQKPNEARPGTFRVAAGQRSDIGRLIVDAPVYSAPPYSALYGAIARGTRLPEHAAARFGADAPLLSLPPLDAPWLDAGDAGAAESAALTHPVGYEPPVELGTAGIAFPAGIAGVALLTPDGDLRRCIAPQLHAVLAVHPAPGGNGIAVVGGEHGLFARLDADCTYRPIDRGNLPAGVLRWLHGDDARGWVAIVASGVKTDFYRAARLEAGDWQRIGGFVSGVPERRPNFATSWIWATPQGFAYAVSAGQIQRFDLATGTWTQHAAPLDKVIASAGGSGPRLGMAVGTTGAKDTGALRAYVPGMGGKVFVSDDHGTTWTPVGKPKKVIQDPPMVTAAGTVLQVYGSLAPWRPSLLFRSTDGGTNWLQVPIELEPGTRLTQVPGGRIFATSYLSIRVSEDDGLTWKRL